MRKILHRFTQWLLREVLRRLLKPTAHERLDSVMNFPADQDDGMGKAPPEQRQSFRP